MTGLLVKIKHNCPAVWRMVEYINGKLMHLRYPTITEKALETLSEVNHPKFTWSIVEHTDIQSLSEFLTSIPSEKLKYFNPHPFDVDTLSSMLSSHSFLMIKVTHGDRIVGYHFLRCFFIGKAFHGLIVDDNFGGQGIGTEMWRIASEISHKCGVRMLATISENNIPSLSYCRKGCHAIVTEHLPDGYLLINCTPHIINR